jgi:hypothetical protein
VYFDERPVNTFCHPLRIWGLGHPSFSRRTLGDEKGHFSLLCP